MSKEAEDLLRMGGLVLIFLLLMMVAIKRISNLEKHIKELENAPADTITLVKYDTIRITEPKLVYRYVSDTAYIVLTDQYIKHDTIKELVYLPREYMVYKDSTYRAVVSGVQPRLDSLEVFPKTTIQTITKTITKKEKTRWGAGVQVGAGYNGKKFQPFVGVGVQYNIFSW